MVSEDLQNVQSRARHSFLRVILTSAALAFFVICIVAAYPAVHWWMAPNGCEHDYTRKWQDLYAVRTRSVFKLPSAIQVVSARERHGFDGEYHTITFRLPPTRRPEAWLKQIAIASGLKEKDRLSRFEYRGLDIWGSTVVYDPTTAAFSTRVTLWVD